MSQIPVPGQQFGRYRIDEQIGLGGMGVVYAATDTHLNRRVALKVISGQLAADAEFRQRFQREAEALARLDSPHVIAIFDHGEEGGTPYIATQFVNGGDLGRLVRERGPLPVSLAAALCAQVAEALHDAHRVGVVHRDVKAGNVLVRDPGAERPFVYLCDFGIAQTEAEGLTRTGGVAGSWAYIAPERASGEPAGPPSDLYALGCLFWVLVSGQPPYSGTDMQVAVAHQNAPIPQLGGDEPAVARANALLARVLAKDPARRHADAAALRADFEEVAATGAGVAAAGDPLPPQETTRSRRPTRPAHPSPRRRGVLVLAAVLALALLGVGGWWLAGRGDDDEVPPRDGDRKTAVRGDVDADGYGDLVVTQTRRQGDRDIATLTWRSTGVALDRPQEGPPQDGFQLRYADVDGNGRLDSAVLDPPTFDGAASIDVTMDDGSTWSQEFTWDADVYSSSTWMLADADGDGRADLVVRAHESAVTGDAGPVRSGVWVAASDGTKFGKLEQWYADEDGDGNELTEPGDFDGDGDADLALKRGGDPDAATYDPGTMRVLTADDGRYTLGEDYRVTGPGWALATPQAGDFDGDGNQELVLLGGRGKTVGVYEVADGAVSGWKPWAQDLDYGLLSDYGQLRVADFDGDGKDDLGLLRPPARGAADVLVLVSTGTAFEDGAVWGRLSCDEECGDEFFVVP